MTGLDAARFGVAGLDLAELGVVIDAAR